jgi:hypothetical protein
MRTAILGIALLLVEQASARPILSREPYNLNPFVVVYVQNGTCGSGKMLKVVGSLRGVQRKRTCVSASSARAEF